MRFLAGRLPSTSRVAAWSAVVFALQLAAACSPDSPGVVTPAAVNPTFAIVDLTNGPVVAELKSAWLPTQCATLDNDKFGNGTRVELQPCSGAASQKFELSSDGLIRIGSRYCVDAYNQAGRRGDAVVIWTCHGETNQLWRQTSDGEIRGINNLCITFSGHPDNNTPLYIDACRDRDSEKWIVAPVSAPAPAPVASVSVSLSAASIGVGSTAQATAILRDASGNVMSGRTVTWSSSSSSVASITAAGLISAVAAGSTNIVASSEGQSASASLTVTATSPAPVPPPTGGLSVVPGLTGFGVTTPAGRGGAVLRVTNLNDSGVGSLRAALTASGPRVVVFEVSGTITLSSKIGVSNPNLTVAGQTAPSPGITIRGAGISIRTRDVLIQHLRFRDTGDGLEILGPGGYNIVADHISSAWGRDENASTWYDGVRDVTLSNAIFNENIGSGALLVGDGTKNFLVVNTLFAHNQDRNPYFKGATTGLMANSVVYNWGGNQAFYTADPEGSGASQVGAVGNLFLRGPSTPSGRPIQFYSSSKAGSKLYVAGNAEGRGMTPPADPWSLVRNDFGATGIATSPPVWPAGLNVGAPATVYSEVLAQAGAWPAARDAVDERIVSDVRNGTGRVATAVGSVPTLPTTQRALTLPSNPSGDDDGDGYTNLEEWLHSLARAAEGR